MIPVRKQFGRAWALSTRVVVLACFGLWIAPAAFGACVGDCNGDGAVVATESDICGDIARGGRPVTDCLPCDGNGDGMVSLSETSQALQNVEFGCPVTPPDCIGDCNGDGSINGDESGRCDLIAQGFEPLSFCAACDSNNDGQVSFFEVNTAMNNEQNGCPSGQPTPTRTRTPTTVPSATATAAAVATDTPVMTPTPTEIPVTSLLASAIATTDELIPLDDVTGFPASGVVQIDEELIRYSGIQLGESGFAGAGAGALRGSLIVAERGFMGTPIQAHGDGAMVVVIATLAACVGDCSGDGTVTIDEILRGVNIALGTAQASECPSFDENTDSMVTIDELLKAVTAALNGCPS